jgi:hypothetical protein
MSPLHAVITTIQPPTAAVRGLSRALRPVSGQLLIVGDRKGPLSYPLPATELLSLEKQLALPLRLPRLLPVNHYVRKNIGYLVAISRGAEVIYETDDDNRPAPNWKRRTLAVQAVKVRRPRWFNAFRRFTPEHIWPRGFPLNEILARPEPRAAVRQQTATVISPIQQGLVDGNPDVDAIWRLVLQQPFKFRSGPSVALMPGVWCPFNSQSTWWWPLAYPLLYLPSHCTFRMTDIWRSFVAQRCLWECAAALTFHAPEVFQQRNVHDLMRDFRDEVPGYLENDRICRTLEDLSLERGPEAVSDNLRRCYEALVAQGIFPKKELALVKAWLRDLQQMQAGRGAHAAGV